MRLPEIGEYDQGSGFPLLSIAGGIYHDERGIRKQTSPTHGSIGGARNQYRKATR